MKSKRKVFLALSLLPAAALMLPGFAINSAVAACSGNQNGWTCTWGAGTITGAKVNITTGSSAAYAVDASTPYSGAYNSTNGTDNGRPLNVTITDSQFTNQKTATNQVGVNLTISQANPDVSTQNANGGTGNGLLVMVGTPGTPGNVVTTYGGGGILVNNKGNGNAEIDISGPLTVTTMLTPATINSRTGGGNGGAYMEDGVEATARGKGNATINMTAATTGLAMDATGTINVNAGNGILIENVSTGGSGNVTGNISSGMTINVDNRLANARNSNYANSGIKAYVAGSGTVNLTTAATINTTGPKADGILATATTGDVKVANSGGITTSGGNSSGIAANATRGTVDLTNSGTINVDGTGADGILVSTATAGANNAGNVNVGNSGVITSGANTATGGKGINASSTAVNGATGTVTVNSSNGITTAGTNAAGISATTSTTGTGTPNAVSVTTTGGTITTHGDGSPGIYAVSSRTINPTTGATGNVTIDNAANITTNGTGAGNYGIYALSGTGFINATNSGVIQTAGATSDGIYAETGAPAGSTFDPVTGDPIPAITIGNNNAITTTGADANAISAKATSGTGDVLITNTGALTTEKVGSDGILANTKGGNITIDNSIATGTINTSGDNSVGIAAVSQTGVIGITNGATINTGGGSADGIYATTGAPGGTGAPTAISILNTNTITTTGADSNAIHANGTDSGDILIRNSGKLSASGNGILAETAGGTVTVENSAEVYGKEAGVAGVATDVGATFTVTNQTATSRISGAKAGISLTDDPATGGTFTSAQITNYGIIEADNDLAIDTSGSAAQVTIDNKAGGIINGYMTLGPAANVFNNDGTWNLKNSNDTAAGTVARADMGDGAIINNNSTGVINLVGISGPGNAYVPLATGTAGLVDGKIDNANNTPAVGGPVQGQILGVKTFTNAGKIDLTNKGANMVGSVLVISGSTSAAWQPGVASADGGEYVSAGGHLVMNTVYNEGGAAAQSDVLVVDSTRVAGGATTIHLPDPTQTLGALTPGDGIPLVEVLRKGNNPDGSPASAPGAFVLDAPNGRLVTAGAYQYTLWQNGYTNADGNWYLRSTMEEPGTQPPPQPPPDPPQPRVDPPAVDPPTVDPPAVAQPSSPSKPAPAPAPIIVPNYRPEVPVYMTAPVLAQRMGLLMLGTYHHRVGEDRPMNWRGNDPEADLNADAKAPAPSKDQATDCAETAKNRSMAAWGRLVGQTGRAGYDDHTYSQFRENGPDYNFDIGALQAGFDVLRAKHDDLTRDNAGLYLGYMRGTAEVNYVYSNIGRAGRVDMNGYSLGGYWTHKGVSEWYLDGVLQGTRYDQAEAYSEYTPLNQKIYPNGYGLVASLEAGIPFGPREGWRWEPQAQLIYQYVTLDNGSDRYGWVEYGDTSTLYGRIGARLTKDWVRDQEKKDLANCADERKRSVWARVNLWHSFGSDADTTFTALNGMGATTLTTSMGDTWGQLGLGVSGQLSQRMTAYLTGDYNMALTDGNGEAFSGEVGLRYEF